MKYEIQITDMKLGIAHLQEIIGSRNPSDPGRAKTLAVIYAEGKNIEHMVATIDLCAAAFDLLNQRLAQVRKELDPKPDENVSNLAWYHRELAKGNGDLLTLEDHP